jgi:ribosomal-protein-alanine N-acetyltransferase
MDITVRPGPQALDQAKPCAALHTAAFAASGARGWSENEMQDLLARPSTTLLTLPGGFLLTEIIDDEAEIITFAVDPARQGQGLGTALLDSFCNICRCRSVTRCILEVAENNTNAIRVYEIYNFKKISLRKNYFRLNIGRVGAIVMEKHFSIS